MVAILRLSVPYTGIILTARRAEVRKEVIPLGVSQIDAGTRIGVGGYKSQGNELPEKEQFQLGDVRSLDDVIGETCKMGGLPSFVQLATEQEEQERIYGSCKIQFCTYFCMPNAILTLKEYLLDYASEETKIAGEKAIENI